MRSIIICRMALVALALLAALGVGRPALAQSHIIAVEPHAGARLTESPERVRVTFSEPIMGPSALQILDVYGRVLASVDAPALGAPATLEVIVLSLRPGIYTAVWSVTGVGGGELKGNFAFTVLSLTPADIQAEQVAVARTVESLTGHAPPSPLALALRGAMLLGAAGAVGGWAFFVALLLPALSARGLTPAPSLVRRWRRWVTGLLALSIAAAALMLIVYTLEVADRPDLSILPAVALGSRYGFLLVARIALASILLMLLGRGAAAPAAGWRGLSELAPAGGLLLLTFAMSGHAAAAAAPLLPVAAEWLHLSATALWLGGAALFALLLPGLLRALPRDAHAPLLGQLAARFAGLSLLSVAALAATGVYAAHSDLGEIWRAPYGLAFSVPVDPLAAPQAPGADTVPSYRQVDETIMADDLSIKVGVDPTLAGSSTLRVALTDDLGQMPPDVQRVRLIFERPDLDIGEIELEAVLQPDSTYKVSGPLLSVLGNWRMRVQVLRPAAGAVEAAFTLPMIGQNLPIFFCTFT